MSEPRAQYNQPAEFTPEFIAEQKELVLSKHPDGWHTYQQEDGLVNIWLGNPSTGILMARDLMLIDAKAIISAMRHYPAALAEIERLREAMRTNTLKDRFLKQVLSAETVALGIKGVG